MKSKIFFVSVFAVTFACLTNNASAQTTTNTSTPAPTNTATQPAKDGDWGKEHPRRKEVNNRIKNQDERIDKKEANGTMSKAEGDKLKKNDREIRHEEKDMAKQNGGHITKEEQKTLNHQENKNSRKIKNH